MGVRIERWRSVVRIAGGGIPMNKKFGLLLVVCVGVFAACQNESETEDP